jgi:hypothetical protein
MSYSNSSYGGYYSSIAGNSYADAGGFITNQGPSFGNDMTTGVGDSPARKV